jgi:hypothetical protein
VTAEVAASWDMFFWVSAERADSRVIPPISARDGVMTDRPFCSSVVLVVTFAKLACSWVLAWSIWLTPVRYPEGSRLTSMSSATS